MSDQQLEKGKKIKEGLATAKIISDNIEEIKKMRPDAITRIRVERTGSDNVVLPMNADGPIKAAFDVFITLYETAIKNHINEANKEFESL